jgi:hypothetical protein
VAQSDDAKDGRPFANIFVGVVRGGAKHADAGVDSGSTLADHADGEGFEHTFSAARKLTERSATRRKMTPELLRRVAEIYNNTPATQADARVDVVVAAFGGISKRQAWRYIAQAKRNGLIK